MTKLRHHNLAVLEVREAQTSNANESYQQRGEESGYLEQEQHLSPTQTHQQKKI